MRIGSRCIARLAGAGLLLGIIATATCLAASSEQKVALVIGNSAYPSSALRNPVNDAKAMAAKLGSLGFDVILRTDANFRDMTRAVSQFGQKLKGGSVGLFYFAGHGLQVRGKNFLVPVDAEIDTEASTRSEALDVDQVLEQLGAARLSMVILDACRNNPFERRFRSAGNGGLAQIDAPTGSMLAYATAPGKVAFDGTGANGLYTTELLKALDTPGLRVEDVFKQVRINVLKASDNQQIPWESSSLTGEFYFRPDTRPQSADINVQQLVKERADLQKTVDDERRRREQDTEQVRKEMEALRKELLALRQTPAAAPLSVAPPITTVVSTPPADPIQNPAVASSTPAPGDQPSANAAVPPVSVEGAAEWEKRIALLKKIGGKLNHAKAFAVLLDISAPADLEELIRFESKVNGTGWSNAYAIGLDAQGNSYWSYGGRFNSAAYARNEVLEFCGKIARTQCRVLSVNLEFQEDAFYALADQFKSFDLASLRRAFLDSFRKPVRDAMIHNGSATSSGYLTSIYFAQ